MKGNRGGNKGENIGKNMDREIRLLCNAEVKCSVLIIIFIRIDALTRVTEVMVLTQIPCGCIS
jgi:hypothetical protein